MDQISMLIAAVTGLGGCVGFLWKQAVDNHQSVMLKLTDCESDREDLWREIANLNNNKRGEVK